MCEPVLDPQTGQVVFPGKLDEDRVYFPRATYLLFLFYLPGFALLCTGAAVALSASRFKEAVPGIMFLCLGLALFFLGMKTKASFVMDNRNRRFYSETKVASFVLVKPGFDFSDIEAVSIKSEFRKPRDMKGYNVYSPVIILKSGRIVCFTDHLAGDEGLEKVRAFSRRLANHIGVELKTG